MNLQKSECEDFLLDIMSAHDVPWVCSKVIDMLVLVANKVVDRKIWNENTKRFVPLDASFSEMVFELINQGEVGWAPENQIQRMLDAHNNNIQEGMHRWDDSVFVEYYEVDPIKVIRKWITYNIIEKEL